MNLHNRSIGAKGEEIALNFLKKNLFRIINKNFRCKYGEVDIIAVKENKIFFIEVKCRTSLKTGYPYEAVTALKFNHLRKTAGLFLLNSKYKKCKLSLGVVSIVLKSDLSLESLKFYDEF